MLAVAKYKSDAIGAEADWVCSDIIETPSTLDNTADLVYTGCGALPWMMDINAWAAVVERLLKSGGKLFVFEGHPLDWVWDNSANEYRLDTLQGNYYSNELNDMRWPMTFLESQVRPTAAPTAREHQWTLGDIINSLVEVGLVLEHFDEYPTLFWNQFPNLPAEIACRLPHTFSLLMRKH